MNNEIPKAALVMVNLDTGETETTIIVKDREHSDPYRWCQQLDKSGVNPSIVGAIVSNTAAWDLYMKNVRKQWGFDRSLMKG